MKKCETPCLCDTCLKARDEEINRVKDYLKENIINIIITSEIKCDKVATSLDDIYKKIKEI